MFKDHFKIFLLCIGLYLYLGPFQEIMLGESINIVFDWLYDFQSGFLTISTLVIFALFGIITYTILKKTFTKYSNWQVILFIILGFIAVIAIRFIMQEVISLAWFDFDNYVSDSLLFYVLDNTYYSILYGGIGALYFLYEYVVESEKNKKKLEIKNKETQLSFLRAQVNPHFLFNSLNNIYALVNKKSEEALPAIEMLSGLMRYSLYEQNEKVPLEKELSLINDFIRMEEFRVENDIEIRLELADSPNTENIRIAPYILLPFVENAFKHGDLHNRENPIEIRLLQNVNNFVFEVKNAKKAKVVDGTGGIGLTNIQQRLQLIYGDNHSLEIINANDRFHVTLKIDKSQC